MQMLLCLFLLNTNILFPGGLKNAIVWASRGQNSPIINKPVALMGATRGLWGTVRMQQAFRPIFQYFNMFPANKPEVLVAQAQTKFNSELKLTDELPKCIIRQQLEELKKLMLQLRK